MGVGGYGWVRRGGEGIGRRGFKGFRVAVVKVRGVWGVGVGLVEGLGTGVGVEWSYCKEGTGQIPATWCWWVWDR